MHIDPFRKAFFTSLLVAIGIGALIGAIIGEVGADLNDQNVWEVIF